MRYATPSGSGTGSGVLDWVSVETSSISMITQSNPSSRDRRPSVVMTATGAASLSMNPMRACGSAGSIARYAAPDFTTASIVTTARAERSRSSATHSPVPMPRSESTCANRLADSSSSR